jgi:uncharacterized protein (TIGR00369 family)
MASEEHFRRLERLYAAAPTNEYYRPEIRISEGRAEVAVRVRPEFFHAAGAVHGSVYFKLLDDAAYFAVNSLVEDVMVLTTQFNLYLLRPVTEGEMWAAGRVVQASRRLFVAESELVDERGKPVARGSGTFLRSEIRLDEGVRYG